MASKFVQKVEQLVAANPLVMFSKTTCGYCGRGECRRAHGARGREGGGGARPASHASPTYRLLVPALRRANKPADPRATMILSLSLCVDRRTGHWTALRLNSEAAAELDESNLRRSSA